MHRMLDVNGNYAIAVITFYFSVYAITFLACRKPFFESPQIVLPQRQINELDNWLLWTESGIIQCDSNVILIVYKYC